MLLFLWASPQQRPCRGPPQPDPPLHPLLPYCHAMPIAACPRRPRVLPADRTPLFLPPRDTELSDPLTLIFPSPRTKPAPTPLPLSSAALVCNAAARPMLSFVRADRPCPSLGSNHRRRRILPFYGVIYVHCRPPEVSHCR
jgi:hypothetical protein